MNSWDGIEEFVAAAVASSFVAGARKLGVSTSHVSRAIARLENRIQAPLFFRTTRKITLTDTGRTLMEQCQRIIQERDEALALASGASDARGELRLTCATTLGERFVAPILRRFVQDNPRVCVHLELTNRLVDLVAEGYDLAIRTGHMADSRLIGVKIATRRLRICAAPAYLKKHGTPRAPSDLAQHTCLVGSSAIWRFKVGGERVELRPNGRWRCNSGMALLEAALAGMGVCQLPDYYVRGDLARGALVCLLDDFRDEDEPIWALYPERRHVLPKVRNVLDQLKREIGPALSGAADDILLARGLRSPD